MDGINNSNNKVNHIKSLSAPIKGGIIGASLSSIAVGADSFIKSAKIKTTKVDILNGQKLKEILSKKPSTKKGMIIKAGIIAGATILGAAAGKIIQNQQEKTVKKALAAMLQNYIDTEKITPVSIEDLEAELNIED